MQNTVTFDPYIIYHIYIIYIQIIPLMQSDAKPQGATHALALYTPRFGNELWKLTGHSSGLSRNAEMPRCDVTNVTCTDHLLSYSMCHLLCAHTVYT
jgi:hypothetical protein